MSKETLPEIEELSKATFEALSEITGRRKAFLDDCYLMLRHSLDQKVRENITNDDAAKRLEQYKISDR